MSNTTSQNNQASNNNNTASLLPLLQQASSSRIQMNSGNGRSNMDQNGDRSGSSASQHNPAMQNMSQPPMSFPGIQMNNNNNGGANNPLSQALLGDLAKVVQLSDLQKLLGGMNNNNNSNNNLQPNLGIGNNPEIQRKLQQLGMFPLQQGNAGYGTQSSGDSGEDTSGKFSFSSSRNFGTASASAQSDRRSKKPKHIVVVPCRARGMPMEHNFQTAYFEIPDDIQHGDGLICSFPECRNRGVKFLYCAYCKDPVAKRNFRNRHTHEEEEKKKKKEEAANAKKAPPSSTAKKVVVAKKPHEISEGTGSSNTGSSKTTSISDPTAQMKKHHRQKDSKKRSASTSLSDSDESRKKLARMDNERKDTWAMLLAERPSTDQSDAMSAWLMKVMAVSDPKKTTAQALAQVKAASDSTSESPATLSMEAGSSNEDSNEDSNESPTTDSSSPVDESSPNESSSSDGAVKGSSKKMPSSSKPTSSNDASNEDSSPTNSNESSNDSSSDNQDDMDIKEIWIRD
mmetsp:Transcript_40742/g.117003  ORF Transcript_40742/g.117003 Transcript_40742/m.117003 type:complete len:513 (-) Transcript_40742:361-1899(-)